MGLDRLTRSRAMEAFCRQRAKIDDEHATFWLAEAADWAKRAGEPVKKKVVPRKAPVSLHSASR
jgi:hypothetical protein